MIRTSPLLMAILLSGTSSGAADDAAEAKKILQVSGLHRGLCLHLGCGRADSAGLTAALAEGGEWAVHGLALDDASLARARKAIDAKRAAGRAFAEKMEIPPLPYLPDLANLVVAEDPAALSARGVTREEMLRVLAPEGVLCVREGGSWKKTVKPRPKEMDSWTHPYHGADGNMVSTDRVFKVPIGFRWIDGLPVNINAWAACRGWIVSGGRCYTLSSNEPENLPPSRTKNHYLAARDAFNGLPLWKVNLGTTDNGAYLTWRNAAGFAADEKRVYAPAADKAIAADAETGKIVATFATQYPPVRLITLEKTVVVTSWEGKADSKMKCEGDSLWATWVPKSNVGTVEAFDAESGKRRWVLASPALQMIGADGTVYLLAQPDNPPTERQVVAVDLKTGKERWRVPHATFGNDPDLQLNCAGPGYLVVGKRKDKAIVALNAEDGKVLWQIKPAGGVWTPVVDGLLWNGNRKYDLKTGEARGPLGGGVPDQGCTPSVVVGPYITQSRGCGYVELPPEGKGGAKYFKYGGARGGCMEGMIPANGMFYTAQNNCRCAPGQIYGFLAIGPCGEVPGAADFEKARPVEKGPAFGATETGSTGDDWPMFRHDAERTAASAAKLPERLREAWKAPAVSPPGEGLVGTAQKARLLSCLSAPVAAGGQVFVAGTDTGQVCALDAATGKKLWTAALGGRVDTPPAVYRGFCIVGCHDGWVYALSAKDGQLAWRARVAPAERRMMAYGEIESVWPAVGAVLVHEGTVYAHAGRTSESDGGIAVVALDPATGATTWARAIAPGPQRMNDLLFMRGGSIGWHHVRLDPKTGGVGAAAPVANDHSQGGIMDGTWTMVGKRRSGNAFAVGKGNEKKQQTMADLLAWSDSIVAAPSFAAARDKAEAAVGPLKQPDFSWRPGLPGQVEAMALCGDSVLYAGRIKGAKEGAPAGFLVILSTQDGKKLGEFPLEAPPTYDGIAVARERVFVSLQNGTVACFGK